MGTHHVLHEPLEIRLERRFDTTVVCVSGACDASSHLELRKRLLQAEVSGAKKIVVDLTDLQFIDSIGLRMLIGAWSRARHADQEFVVALPESGPVHRVFALTGVNRVVPTAAPHLA